MTDDNAAWKARERKRLNADKQEARASAKLYKKGDDIDIGDEEFYSDTVSNGWCTFGTIAVVIAILTLVIMGLVLFSGGMSRVGGAGVLFSGGNCTCIGYRGRDGTNGRDGKDGECTNPCTDGKPGEPGETPMCEFNPMCLTGDIICNCTDGNDGADGICLSPCVDGVDGGPGPRGFNGTCNQQCVNGTDGTNGFNGTDAVCECSEITAIYNLTLNETLIIDGGDIICPNGGTIDLNCLGISGATCLDLSLCDVQALSMRIQDGIGGSVLQVGTPAPTPAGPFQDRIYFGDIQAANYRMSVFSVYATLARIAGDLSLLLTSRQELSLTTTGVLRPIIISATGSIVTSSQSGMSFQNSGSNDIRIINTALTGEIEIRSTNRVRIDGGNDYSVDSPNMEWKDGSTTYLVFDPDQSYEINGTHTYADPSKRSANLHQDLILHPGKRIVTVDPSMKVEVGANLLVTEGGLCSGNGVLTMENDVTLVTGMIQCPVTGCMFSGDVLVDGNFNTTNGGHIGADGTCCTSDPRVKQAIQPIDREEASRRVQRTPVYSFAYTPEYVKAERGHVYDGTLVGFMADEVEREYPYAVRRVHKRVGDTQYDDLMQLNLQMMLADLWAAHQQLREEFNILKQKLK